MKTIRLTGNLEGMTRKCGNHHFVDGEKTFERDEDADKVFKAISKFYPMEMDSPPEDKEPEAVPYVPDAGPKVIRSDIVNADDD